MLLTFFRKFHAFCFLFLFSLPFKHPVHLFLLPLGTVLSCSSTPFVHFTDLRLILNCHLMYRIIDNSRKAWHSGATISGERKRIV